MMRNKPMTIMQPFGVRGILVCAPEGRRERVLSIPSATRYSDVHGSQGTMAQAVKHGRKQWHIILQ